METPDYSKTVHLPKTNFPMKADLPNREPLVQDLWQKMDIYRQMLAQRSTAPKYILHDGPPYANGHLHMGHALNKTLKDMIVKFKHLTGYRAFYVPGWDCHGLPIEHQLMQKLGKTKHTVDRVEFRQQAAEFAREFVEIQKKEFLRLGVGGDWDNPYLTLDPAYEEGILRTFRELLKAQYIYRGQKPVPWCWQCETALADAEIEYEDKSSTSVFAKLNASQVPQKFKEYRNLSFIVWTTTPWTLPANVGFMMHPELSYSIVQVKDEHWVLASALVQKLLQQKLQLNADDYKVIAQVQGLEFEGSICARIFPESGNLTDSCVIFSTEVSSEDGSGIVHIAPGHGEIDYFVGHVQNKLPVLSPVADNGTFAPTVGVEELKNLFVLSKGNAQVLELLKAKNLYVYEEKITHSYPHCWRCKKPIIFRATYQWFLSVEKNNLRAQLTDSIEKVQWVPPYGKNRIGGMVAQRPDWCLSRQRLWGTPIPIFYCKDCGHTLDDDQAVGMVEEIIGIEGSDIWFKEEADYFLKNCTPFQCAQCGGKNFRKETDILDVWFDSGASSESVLKGRNQTLTGKTWKEELSYPADLYLEGSDQHRGWFQSSLIPAVALHGAAPYKAVLTHGFIVDGQGKKMSKSAGNAVALEQVLKEYGADILRLWVASSDYREDIRISKDILKGVADNYRKLRNTFRYILGSLCDFDVEKNLQSAENLMEVDRWILARLDLLTKTCRASYDAFEFHRVVSHVVEFVTLHCSSFYFDVLKDRLYTYGKDDVRRRAAQTALYHIARRLSILLSPIMPFTCEEVWQEGVSQNFWIEKSVLLTDYPQENLTFKSAVVPETWDKFLKLRSAAHQALEESRSSGIIGSSLESKIVFEGYDEAIFASLAQDLPMLLIVSEVEFTKATAQKIIVSKATLHKCPRCWRRVVNAENELCSRCTQAIE